MCQEMYFVCSVLINLHNSREGGIIITLGLYLKRLGEGNDGITQVHAVSNCQISI